MEHRRAVQRIEHLNRVLRAIRDVDQLIAHERDRDTFIRMACRLLVDSRGYASALIILTDQDNRPASWAETGLDAVCVPLAEMLEKGEIPPCCTCVRWMDEVRKESERQREALEVQLFQVQKLESVGRLAGGVAHDYNNMLSVIIGFAELGLEKVEANDPLYTNFEEILLAANRSKEITRQLLAFARQNANGPWLPFSVGQKPGRSPGTGRVAFRRDFPVADRCCNARNEGIIAVTLQRISSSF